MENKTYIVELNVLHSAKFDHSVSKSLDKDKEEENTYLTFIFN